MSKKEGLTESIFMYLLYNQGHFKKEFEPFEKQRDHLLRLEDSSFHEEINNQYTDLIKQSIVDGITRDLAISTEDAIIVIEALNLNEYLKR